MNIKKPHAFLLLWTVFLFYCAEVRAQTIVIENARIFPMQDESAVEFSSVTLENGVIRSFSNSPIIPSTAKVVDAMGKFITPGLFDAHTQIGLEEIDAVSNSVNSRLNSEHIGPAFDIQYAVNPSSTLIQVNLVEGVTHAVVAPTPGSDFFSGFGAAIRLTNVQPIYKPRIAMFGAINSQIIKKAGGSSSEVIARLIRTSANLKQLKSPKYPRDKGDYSKADIEAIDYAYRKKLPIVINVNHSKDILQLIDIAKASKLNLILMGGAEAWKVANKLSDSKIPVILDPLDNLPSDFDQLGARLDNSAILQRAGVTIAFSDPDSHNSRRLRQLAGNAVAHGLPWYEGLKAITRSPAIIYSLENGSLTTGSKASLVIWNGDPLEVTSWPEKIMFEGQWISLESRQTALYKRYQNLSAGKKTGFTYQ